MAKSKSLGYQIHSALAEINLQDKEKRTDFLKNSFQIPVYVIP